MNTLTASSFGARRIWKENSAGSYSMTTIAVFISRWMGARLLKLVTDTNHCPQNRVTIRGYQTATDFFRHQLLRELRVRPGHDREERQPCIIVFGQQHGLVKAGRFLTFRIQYQKNVFKPLHVALFFSLPVHVFSGTGKRVARWCLASA